MMDGGDLKTHPRRYGGDLQTVNRQHGGIFGLLYKLTGLGEREFKQMSDPLKQQMLMQRGGFPWALAGLSLLPMLLGKGQADSIRYQMQTTRDPLMQRGGLTLPPMVLSKGLPLLKQLGIPLAMGALASIGDNVVDKVFGDGKTQRVQRKRVQRKRVQRRVSNRRSRVTRRTRAPRRRTAIPRKKVVKGKRSSSNPLKGVLTRKTREIVQNNLQNVGRQIFEKAQKRNLRLESSPTSDNPFTQKLQKSINSQLRPRTTVSSSHIGQAINI